MKSDYIIDFDRVNELTSHNNDSVVESPGFGSVFIHSMTRRLIKDYMEIYQGRYRGSSDKKKVEEVIETLHYNRILISKSDMRDNKIKEVLE